MSTPHPGLTKWRHCRHSICQLVTPWPVSCPPIAWTRSSTRFRFSPLSSPFRPNTAPCSPGWAAPGWGHRASLISFSLASMQNSNCSCILCSPVSASAPSRPAYGTNACPVAAAMLLLGPAPCGGLALASLVRVFSATRPSRCPSHKSIAANSLAYKHNSVPAHTLLCVVGHRTCPLPQGPSAHCPGSGSHKNISSLHKHTGASGLGGPGPHAWPCKPCMMCALVVAPLATMCVCNINHWVHAQLYGWNWHF